MINLNFNNISSGLWWVYNYFLIGSSYYYLLLVNTTLFLFLCYRFPYCYSPYLFLTFLVVVVFGLFLCLFSARFCDNVSLFLSTFIPLGTPLYICPLVCLAESISYFIRPFVLIIRPFINISLGCSGAIFLGNMCFLHNCWFIILIVLFFYEVFVALIHWFIVISILSFSENH